jgi:hypothetical protein
MDLSHAELVSLYLALSRHEKELDEMQYKLLERLARELHMRLSVSEMEEIESYYQALDA